MKYFFFFFFTVYIQWQCNKNLVSSFGIDGLVKPQKRDMLLCNNIQYSCCSELDEMKFHKYWNQYYKIKIDKVFDVIEDLLKKLNVLMIYINDFDLQSNIYFIPENHIFRATIYLQHIKDMQLKETLPLITKLVELKQKDIEYKETFICQICDYNSHLKVELLAQKYAVQKLQCQKIIENYKEHILHKNIILDEYLLQVDKFFDLFELQDEIMQKNEIQRNKIERIIYASKKCEIDKQFKFEKCKELCEYYSYNDVSGAFFGDIDFYRYILQKYNYLQKYIQDSKRVKEQAIQAQLNIQKKKEQELAEKKKKEEEEKKKKEGKKKDGDKKEGEGDKKEGEGEQKEGEGEKKEGEEQKAERILSSKESKKTKYSIYRKNRIQKYKRSIQKRILKKNKYNRRRNIKKYRNNNNKIVKQRRKKRRLRSKYSRRSLNVEQKKEDKKEDKKEGKDKDQQELEKAVKDAQEQQKKKELNFETEEQAIEYIKKEFDPYKEFTQDEIQQLENQYILDIYKEIYEKTTRGSLSQFEKIDWINNKVFESKYFEGFKLHFTDMGNKLNYQLSELYSKPAEKIIEKVIEIEKKKNEKKDNNNSEIYKIKPFEGMDYEVWELLRSYSDDDIQNIAFSAQVSFGEIESINQIEYIIYKKEREEQMEQKIKKLEQEEQKKKKKKEKKKDGEKKEDGEENKEEKVEEKQEEEKKEARRLLKVRNKIKKLINSKNY